MTSGKFANRYILALATGLTGLYIYDVQYNHGRNVDQLGLYNWNPPPKVEVYSDSAYNAGVQKAEEFKNSASSWINEKNSNIQENAQQAGSQIKDSVNSAGSGVIDRLESSKDRFSSFFGSSKESAQSAYASAWEKYYEAEDKASKHKKGWLQWGESKKDDSNKELEAAKKNLDSARDNLSKYGSDVLKDTEQRLNEWSKNVKQRGSEALEAGQKNVEKFTDNFRGQLSDKDIAKEADRAIAGFGQLAGEVANEHIGALSDKTGLFAAKTKESAQKLYDYYDEQSKQAKKQYDETQSSWLRWRKAKSQEAQDAAKKQYEEVLKQKDQAQNNLNNYLNQVNENVKDGSSKLIQQTKQGLSNSNDQAQSWLSKLNGWVRGN
ncbi:hypothetical protein OGAPHI_005245 [Ogataea philodendri]|uniref:Uncharacterized protein n=1 Tax=Ogataea philodendri TaxID=1378263 RepID=A0A9P8P258_9ASCO|nr:uncharacterized protein OGAPHI_005245 [Ogataea philodendri]KAH3663842.1 hypothetical protein OGAPHI_005245 [Ogataea philodendri]